MITELKQYMLYFCPECSKVGIEHLSAFKIGGEKGQEIVCSKDECKQEFLGIYKKKNKYEFVIDCPVCGNVHTFTISSKTLWQKEFFKLNCNETGFGILFFGKDKERLKAEYYAQNELIAGILAENDEEFGGFDLLFEIVEILNKFALENKVQCSCLSEKISINVDREYIELCCRDCKKKKQISVTKEEIIKIKNSDLILID